MTEVEPRPPPMISHTYEFGARDVVRLAGPTLIIVAAFALVMHAGRMLGTWPAPRPTLDVDRTLLLHQVEAASTRQDATVLLLGDSSCLTGVDAAALGARIGERVLNLATLSYLDLEAHALLLRDYLAHNPRPLRAVVLLMHPEALRRPGPEDYHARLLDSLRQRTEPTPAGGLHPRLLRLLGLDVFRGRFLCRWLPAPLPGAFGRFYGFSADLETFLASRHGSLVEPEPQPFRGNAEYRLAPTLESASRAFRRQVPPDTAFFAGITPVPAAFAGPGYPDRRDALLEQWGRWLRADALLSGLPATLPDLAFAKTTHLNAGGARHYTGQLARELERRLPAP
ncbi:MAG: hypothetical protein JXQ71_13275 [Verrucomicrobia bacterium]|nr:hypothetical protein [Verrucomicrobiota bacterium]